MIDGYRFLRLLVVLFMLRLIFGKVRWVLCVAVLFAAFDLCSKTAAEDPPRAISPVLKLFQGGRLPPERLGTVVEMICNRGNEHDLRVIFDRVMQEDGFTTELRLKSMGWLTEAALTRKIKPAGDLHGLYSLMNSNDPALQLAAIRLISTWRVSAVSKSLEVLATAEKASPELQHTAIDGLIAIADPESQHALLRLAESHRPITIRMQSVAGLVRLDLTAAAALAADIFSKASAQDNLEELLNAFCNHRDGTDQLATAMKDRKPAVDVALRALRYLYSVGRSDAALSSILSEAAGIAQDAPPPTPAEVAELVTDVLTKGNATRGEAIFRRSDISCMRCHSVSRAGGQVGPDLSAIGGSSPVDYVIHSILNPNLAVKEQYMTRIFSLSNGLVLTGVLIDRDENRVRIRDGLGKIVTISTADIDQEIEGKSLMPQGLTKFLTRDELLDLAKFISELGKPGDYEIRKNPTIQRWRVLRHPAEELTADVPHIEHLRQSVLRSQVDDWTSVYSRVAGVLPLNELRLGKTPTVLILQGLIQVNQAGKVGLSVHSDETLQVWVNTESFEHQKQFEMSLEPGPHTITVRVEVSARESPELKLELSKPEGSTAQFDVVGGM